MFCYCNYSYYLFVVCRILKNKSKTKYYTVQYLNSSGSWNFVGFDYYGYPPGFDANGKVWQQTGYPGVYTKKEAFSGLVWLENLWPDKKFRVVKIKRSFSVTPIDFF